MNSPKFPWGHLSFAFIFALISGFVYLPLQSLSLSLPWWVWIIVIPLGALIYAITESIFSALLDDLKLFLGSFLAYIVVVLSLVSGLGIGFYFFYLFTVLIKSK
jgi:hypothetical protein